MSDEKNNKKNIIVDQKELIELKNLGNNNEEIESPDILMTENIQNTVNQNLQKKKCNCWHIEFFFNQL